MDTRDVLVVSPTSDGTSVDLVEDASNARLDAWFKKHGSHKLIIATGFIAKNVEVRPGCPMKSKLAGRAFVQAAAQDSNMMTLRNVGLLAHTALVNVRGLMKLCMHTMYACIYLYR